MKEKMISVTSQYFGALSSLDRERYLACFTADAELRDPFGGKPFDGVEGLNKWFTGLERAWSKFVIEPDSLFVGGNRVAAAWQARAVAKSEKGAAFSGINVFFFNDGGLIQRLEGYWDFQEMLTQIS